MLKESGAQKATGSYHIYFSLVKLQPWFLSLQWKTCLWTELQPAFAVKDLPLGRTLIYIYIYIYMYLYK